RGCRASSPTERRYGGAAMGRPKGTRKITARWYARLWFDVAMVRKNQRGRTRNLWQTVDQLQRRKRYGNLTTKHLRDYLTRPPFRGLPREEAAQFIVSTLSYAILYHSVTRRVFKQPPASADEIARLAINFMTLQADLFANEYGISADDA